MDRLIETERLALRLLRESDANDIVEHVGDFAVSRNLAVVPHPYHRTDAEEFLARATVPAQGTRHSAICLKATPGHLIGIISYEAKQDGDVSDLGYWLARPFWGKGLMGEAVPAMVDHAFSVARLSALKACYFDGNPASGRLLAKAGFVSLGACTCMCRARGEEVPVTNMELTRDAWRNKKAAVLDGGSGSVG